MSEFLEKIRCLTSSHESPKLEYVKKRIEEKACKGENEIVLDSHFYDSSVLTWFRINGFDVKETLDQRDGDFVRIKWMSK